MAAVAPSTNSQDALSAPPPSPPPNQGQSSAADRPRLSIPIQYRLLTATAMGFATGLALGSAHSGQMAGLRFRAENAHRLPATTKGWYLYHKTKNYQVALDALKGGGRFGAKLALWAGGFFFVEHAVDRARRRKDFLSTTCAGLSVSGLFSAINGLPLVTAARLARMGLVGGAAFGLVQDALSAARGRPVWYVDWIVGRARRFGKAEQEEDHDGMATESG